ncbi:PAS domain-containing sensor histidine kinase [soil metagenome]
MTSGGAISEDARAVLDAAPCGLMQTSDDGTFRRANRTFCVWLGFTESDLIGRRRLQDLMTMGGRIFHQTHWTPLVRMQGSISEIKFELVHRDGTLVPMVMNAIRRESDGVMVHEVAAYVARDRDRYERELVSTHKRLEELVAEENRSHAESRDRALFAEQMVGIVSHDLRNPLSTIVMGTEMLASSELPSAQQRISGQIIRAADRAQRLISELLDFTQARVGVGLSASRVPVDLHQVVAESIDELRIAHVGREIVHTRSGSGECSVDPDRLAQLLGNLIANAIAYGKRDTPITVASRGEPEQVVISVHNRGEPIPEAIQASLFEPMTRGAKGGEARSIGLGLFIVKEIARSHGGTASVVSSGDEGTTFTVTLPLE